MDVDGRDGTTRQDEQASPWKLQPSQSAWELLKYSLVPKYQLGTGMREPNEISREVGGPISMASHQIRYGVHGRKLLDWLIDSTMTKSHDGIR